MSLYFLAFRNFANFRGRTSMKEYWTFTLTNIIMLAILFITFIFFGLISAGPLADSDPSEYEMSGFGYVALVALFLMLAISIAIFIPSISIAVRRLHDQGKSGAWYFISLVPIIGQFWMLVLMCMYGTPGPNPYGEYPTHQD